MRRICAWCGIDVNPENASKHPETEEPAGNALTENSSAGKPTDSSEITSSICRDCANELAAYRKPVLVVSREWARMYDQLVELLKGYPEIQVILDRRESPEVGGGQTGWKGPDRRRSGRPIVVK